MTKENPRRNTLKALGLPENFGYLILVFTFILAVAPILEGKDFGIFKIPIIFDSGNIGLFRFIGPALFCIAILLHLPVWNSKGKRQELNHVLGELRRASSNALLDLENPGHNPANIEITLGNNFEDLIDKWSGLEKTQKTEQIRNQYHDLVTRFNQEGILTASFRDYAKGIINKWQSYFEVRLSVE